MNDQTCPRCARKLTDPVLYRCIGCNAVYCKDCADSEVGHHCPSCKLTHRMVLPQDR